MFGTELMDAAFLPAALIALAAGVLSFLSPCVLPIVPPYLAYMGGVSVTDMADRGGARRRALRAALFFVLGLSTVFLLMGMSASALGRALGQYQDMLMRASGLLIMVFGAHFVGVYRIGFLDHEARLEAKDAGGSAFGAYLLGLAFAFGWTPCIGPVLGAILGVAAARETVGDGAALLAVYSLGLAVPFWIAAGFSGAFMRFLVRFRRHLGTVEKVMGVLLILTGLAFIFGYISAVAIWFQQTFPILSQIG